MEARLLAGEMTFDDVRRAATCARPRCWLGAGGVEAGGKHGTISPVRTTITSTTGICAELAAWRCVVLLHLLLSCRGSVICRDNLALPPRLGAAPARLSRARAPRTRPARSPRPRPPRRTGREADPPGAAARRGGRWSSTRRSGCRAAAARDSNLSFRSRRYARRRCHYGRRRQLPCVLYLPLPLHGALSRRKEFAGNLG